MRMSDPKFVTYQKFSNKAEAMEIADLLKKNDIEFFVEDDSLDFDPSFANNETTKEYRIKLQQQDFRKADEVMFRITENQLKDVDKDYYLFEFSDEELFEILARSDEWSKFDYLLAKQILKDRGREVEPQVLEELREQRIEELARPEESQSGWIVAGYIFAFLGGFLGVIIGWHLMVHKKTLPDGERVYGYSQGDRAHGRWIVTIGVICMVIGMVIRILSGING
jgi:hypothetical protein